MRLFKNKNLRRIAFGLAFTGAVLGTGLAVGIRSGLAQEWLTKPINFVVPTKTSGSLDHPAREMSPFLREELDQPVKLEPPKARPLILVQRRPGKRERRGRRERGSEGDGERRGSGVPFIDTHTHFLGHSGRGDDYDGSADATIDNMDRNNIRLGIVMPPPFAPGKRGMHDHAELLSAARRYKGRFAVLGGGGSLNLMINEAVAKGSIDDEMKAEFAARAEKILADGAIGFGEMTALHFSLRKGHGFQMAPPDHPLFLLLAEIAQRHKVPIDLHMEAVVADRDIPEHLKGAPNPDRLPANIGAFERLLDHAPGATIVWVHLGWDNTGERTVALVRRLLKAHPNLFMSFKVAGGAPPVNQAFTRDAGFGDEWRDLVLDFPDRFLIGSDIQTRPTSSRTKTRGTTNGVSRLLRELPHDVIRRVAIGNAKRVFRLD